MSTTETSKRGPGRPRLPDDKRRAVRFTVNLSPEQAAKLDALRGDLTRSSFMAGLLDEVQHG